MDKFLNYLLVMEYRDGRTSIIYYLFLQSWFS